MRIVVTGVLEDGTPRSAGVPTNSRHNLNVQRGGDLALEVHVVTPLGTAVPLGGAGTTLIFTAKKRPEQSPPSIVKTATLAGNVGTFLITPADTKRLQPGLYSWDVWLTKGGLRDAVVPLSPLQLQASSGKIP